MYYAMQSPGWLWHVTPDLWHLLGTITPAPNTAKKPVTFSNLIMLAESSWQRISTFNCTCDPRPDGAVCLDRKSVV